MEVTAAPPLESHLARFKLSSFRPGQREVISAILDGHDCLCIMPTGGGKSLCYQLPAVAREGLTLVVSPLIALMKDQVDALTALGIAATFINSSLAPAEAYQRINDMAAGRFDLVYIAPERLRSSLFLEKLRETRVQLLAVDEAHCISEWGHDFRPDYARLGRLRQRLNNPQTIALTATATPDVRGDIVAQLQIREPKVFITGFSRPNLHFEVQQALSEPDRDRMLVNFLRETPGAGIIYSATRKGCEQLVPVLAATAGRRVEMYHAGLEPDARRRVQDDFMSGKTPIIVATNAFGMGIDKSDLRFVVHYNIPGTLEAYYQEAGRAGRDGLTSRCLLLYAQRDRRIQEFFIESAYPAPEIVAEVYDFLREIPEDPIELTLDEIRERLNLPIRSEGVSACEKLLENCKALERLDARQNMAAVRIDSDLPTLVDLLPKEAKVQRRVLQAVERRVAGQRYERVYVSPRQLAQAAEIDANALNRALRELAKLEAFDFVPPFRGRAVHMLERKKPFEQLGIDFEEQERHKEAEYAKLDRMVRYATTRHCRQLEILDYFGDPSRHDCGTCDNCRVRGKSKASVGWESAVPAEPTTGRIAKARQEPRPPTTMADAPQLLDAVRIVLSGVARMKGRYGKQMVARMLVGSKAKDVEKFKLNTLSTFGLLAPLKEAEATGLIDALLAVRLLQQVEENPYRPLVRLTPRGEEVMKGAASFDEPLALDDQLLLRLKSLAPRSPQQPQKPATKAAAGSVSPAQAFREDDALDAVNALLAAADDHLTDAVMGATPAVAAIQPSHHWTRRVLAAGFSAEECLQIRALDRVTLVKHVLAVARDGGEWQLDWIFARERQDALDRLMSNGAAQSLAAVLSRLPPEITPEEAELFWLAHHAKPTST
ncbi:MAG TPA: ATP-dependent DNA helicase RecQ [Pirellulaceae bacterium]|nr:ATP-dependent DNA helicase RecQ [Pirellulaceae bacterium]